METTTKDTNTKDEPGKTVADASDTKQQSNLTKFEDVVKACDAALASNEAAHMKQTLESVKRFAEYRLKKITSKMGDTSSGKAVMEAMNNSRSFKPWSGLENAALK